MSWLRSGIDLNFTNGFSVSRSLQNSSQECVNYRTNVNSKGGLAQKNLYQTEGIDLLLEGGNEPSRGAHTMNGLSYHVIGTTLYRLDRVVNQDLSKTYSKVALGTIAGGNRVIMASIWTGSGYEMAIVSPGEHAYSYREATGTVVDMTTYANFLGPVDDVVSINGFMVFLQTGTNVVFHSNLNDITTYNALDFELITRVETVVGLLSYRGQLYIAGENDILPYSFIGGALFVFQFQPNSTLPGGITNVYAKTVIGRAFFYLGGEVNEAPSIWMSTGGYPEKISTETIEARIRGNIRLNQAYMMNYAMDGGKFVVLQIGNDCFVFDLITGDWHTRTSKFGDTQQPWRVKCINQAYGELIVGDAFDGRIGSLSAADTEYGINVLRSVSTMPFDNKGKYIQVKSIILAADAGFEGEFTMEASNDGGITWQDGITLTAGAIGEYGKILRWDRLGSTEFSKVIRFSTSSGVKANINKLIALT